MRFHRGYKFKTELGRVWEVINYDDTDDLYICCCKEMDNLTTYWEEKEIEREEKI
jgi:hypothetical protein